METVGRLQPPVAGDDPVADYHQPQIAIDRQVFLYIQNLPSFAVAVPIEFGIDPVYTLAFAAAHFLGDEGESELVQHRTNTFMRAGLDQGLRNIPRAYRLERACHFDLVVSQMIAGHAGKDPAIEAVVKAVDLPV